MEGNTLAGGLVIASSLFLLSVLVKVVVPSIFPKRKESSSVDYTKEEMEEKTHELQLAILRAGLLYRVEDALRELRHTPTPQRKHEAAHFALDPVWVFVSVMENMVKLYSSLMAEGPTTETELHCDAIIYETCCRQLALIGVHVEGSDAATSDIMKFVQGEEQWD